MSRLSLFLVLTFSSSLFATEVCQELLQAPDWVEVLGQHWGAQQSEFKRSQRKRYSEALEHLQEDLRGVGEKSSLKDQHLREKMEKITALLPTIHQAYLNLKIKDKKAQYFKASYEALWATLTVHAHEVLEMRAKDKDYPRFFKILQSVEDFDVTRSEFSFYRIKRAIEGRFSLREYNHCKL